MQLLDKNIVLVLNKSWIPCAVTSVRKAFVSLCSESHGKHPVLAIDMEVAAEDGALSYANPVPWETWIQLPIRDGDLYVQSAHQKIRVPTVLVAANFNKLVMKRPKLGKSGIARRDEGVCQYSGKKLTNSQMSIDHIVPKSRGGRDDWLNLVLCDKQINSEKGNRLNSEAGLTLLRAPKAPVASPVVIRPEEISHDSWRHFLVQ